MALLIEKTRERGGRECPSDGAARYLSYPLVLLAYLALAAVIYKPAQAQTPVAYWKLDEGSGTRAFDSSGNGHTAFLSNSLAWAWGTNGWGISANNTNKDYVNIPPIDLSGTRAVTVSFWVMRY